MAQTGHKASLRCKGPRKCSLPIWQEQNHMGVSECSGSSPQLLSSVVIFQVSLLLIAVSDVFLYFSESFYFMCDHEFCVLLLSLPFSPAIFNVWCINYYIIIINFSSFDIYHQFLNFSNLKFWSLLHLFVF